MPINLPQKVLLDPSICPSFYLSFFLSIYYLSTIYRLSDYYLSIYLSVYLSIYLSSYLSIYLSSERPSDRPTYLNTSISIHAHTHIISIYNHQQPNHMVYPRMSHEILVSHHTTSKVRPLWCLWRHGSHRGEVRHWHFRDRDGPGERGRCTPIPGYPSSNAYKTNRISWGCTWTTA